MAIAGSTFREIVATTPTVRRPDGGTAVARTMIHRIEACGECRCALVERMENIARISPSARVALALIGERH